MLKVISFTICPFVQRVTALLEAKQIAYSVEFISLKDKPEWFLQLSPNAQVPVLITEKGQALFESEAIIEYLEEAYPALDSSLSMEDKAQARAWSYMASKLYLPQCSAQQSQTLAVLHERSQILNKAFVRIEKALQPEQVFFASNQLGLVDIAWLPLLHRAALIKQFSGYDFLADYPKLQQWQHNLLATGLGIASVADDFEEKFTGFYLSDKTYLGNHCQDCTTAYEDGCATGSCC